MGQRERDRDLSRRDLFGILGGVTSVATLPGCASEPDELPVPEPTGRITDPILGGTSLDPGAALIREIRFPVTTAAAQTSALHVPRGGVVTSARLDIVIPYSTGATIQVGKSGTPSQLIGASDNDPQGGGLYVVDQDTPWGQAAAILVTVSGSPTTGAGFCIVHYTISKSRVEGDSGRPEASDSVDRTYATWRGALNLPSTTAVALTQGGTLASPTVEFPLVIQPRDPLKAPFQLGLYAPTFNSTVDNVLFFGYNVDIATAGEPFCRFAIEQDYESYPGNHQLECYMECAQNGASVSYRPMGFVINRTTGDLTLSFEYTSSLDILGGPKGGPVAQQIKITDGVFLVIPTNYVIAASNGLVMESLGGGMSFSSPAGDLALAAGVGHACYLSFDTIQLRQGSSVQNATIDNNVSFTRFYPTTDNTGSIGIGGQAWSTVFTHAIHVAAPPAASATAGSSGAAPAQVAGYMPITVNGVSYMIPLYNT